MSLICPLNEQTLKCFGEGAIKCKSKV